MEIINSLLFYIESITLIISVILTITAKRIMNAVLYSLICFFIIGLLFFSLNAPFNGSVQISIYGIALSIIFAIAITLTDYKTEKNSSLKQFKFRYLTIITASIMIITATIAIINNTIQIDTELYQYFNSSHILTPIGNTKQLAIELLKNNFYPFELLGIYLLTVLTGISVLYSFKGGE